MRRLSVFICLLLANLVRCQSDGNSTVTVCSFDGDEDTYGLGIRVGIYVQWFIMNYANIFALDEAANMRSINVGFSIAIFAGLGNLTTANREGPVYAVEYWIVLCLCLGGMFTTVFLPWSNRPDNQNNQTERDDWSFLDYLRIPGHVLQLIVWITVCAYGVWFSFVGMDTLQKDPGTCNQYTSFFLAKVELFNWFRTFLKVMFTFGLAYFTTCTLSLWYFHAHDKYTSQLSMYFFIDAFDSSNRRMRFLSILLFKAPMFIITVFVVISIEFTIKWNRIEGVDSIWGTGQLLPITVAAGGALRTFWKLFMRCNMDGFKEGMGLGEAKGPKNELELYNLGHAK
ncbi:hypothetical protein CPB86DRAFT_788059 [Serendipita vermifera]|nr:hypothetical protein CPB86DRAFT_788059 [Serendipita vermifera]